MVQQVFKNIEMFDAGPCNVRLCEKTGFLCHSLLHVEKIQPLDVLFYESFTNIIFKGKQEVAVGERIAYWIRTPQVPGSRPGWYGTS